MIPIITMLTDFGHHDGYVGAMHGVALTICPQATFVELTHTVPPQDIQTAAFILYQLFDFYPPHTVHCIVVDPGVGSERQAIAVRTEHGIFVAPNNGVLSLVLQATPPLEMVTLTNPTYQLNQISNTFHGRDIFAPVAAHLAMGVPLANMGEPLAELIVLEWPQLSEPYQCRVIHIDHFGNLILDIQATAMTNPDTITFVVGDETILGLSQTFADVEMGDFVAYVGSTRHHIEIGIRNGNAAKTLAIQVGDIVMLENGMTV